MTNNLILILFFLFCAALAGLLSGSETGIYRLSRLRLRLGIGKKQLLYIILGKSLQDGPALLISLLISSNIAYYFATSVMTFMILKCTQTEHSAEVLATVIAAPVFFVFSELIPKSIFFYRADSVMPYVSPIIFFFHKLFSWCGIVGLLKRISGTSSTKLAASASASKMSLIAAQQPHIKAILRDTLEEGFLSQVQTDIINRLATISHLAVRFVMTPLSKTQMVDVKSTRTELLQKLEKYAFTRFPVYDGWPANIIGFVNIYDCLTSKKHFGNLYDLVKTIPKLPAHTSVSDAITHMQKENAKIVLVVKSTHAGREKPIGIVTMKDLVEELLGELAEW